MWDPEWITAREAAEILGVHKSAIPKMRRLGKLTPRPDGRRPFLARAEVEQLRDEREAHGRPRDPNRQTLPPLAQPPDADGEWITALQAAEVLGLSRTGVSSRVQSGSLPSVLHNGRRWFRRDLLKP